MAGEKAPHLDGFAVELVCGFGLLTWTSESLGTVQRLDQTSILQLC